MLPGVTGHDRATFASTSAPDPGRTRRDLAGRNCGAHTSLRQGQGRCEAEPPELHGPHLQWSYTRENKRLTRWLSAEQDER
jgi:hypothetical protein